MRNQRLLAAVVGGAAAGVLALLCLTVPAAGAVARASGSLHLEPDHGLPSAAFVATYKLANDAGCLVIANRTVNFAWDGAKIGSAILDNNCTASLTTKPPQGHRVPGDHTVTAVHGLDTSTGATATYTIEPPPTPTTTEPSPSPTPTFSQQPSPTPTARPTTTKPAPQPTDTSTADLGPPPSTTLLPPTLPPDDSTGDAGVGADAAAGSGGSGGLLIAFIIGGILMASGGAALILLRRLNRPGAE